MAQHYACIMYIRHPDPGSIQRLRNSIRDKSEIPEVMNIGPGSGFVELIKLIDYNDDEPNRIVLYFHTRGRLPFAVIENLEASGFAILADMGDLGNHGDPSWIYANQEFIRIPSRNDPCEWADDPSQRAFDPNIPDSEENVFDIRHWHEEREPKRA